MGRALVIGSSACRPGPIFVAQQVGYQCAESDNPYAAMAEMCRRPLAYRAVILSLASLFREELSIIPAIKRRFPHIEVWLAHTDGRAAALAEASRLGADGLVDDEGLHRFALTDVAQQADRRTTVVSPLAAPSQAEAPPAEDESPLAEPVLTADELRALLQDQPAQRSAGQQET